MIGAIGAALRSEFGDLCQIHSEGAGEGRVGPCFFIQVLESGLGLAQGGGCARINQFLIRYFPESEMEPNRECHETAERMFSCLEWITWEGGRQQRGTRMRYSMEEGRLNFFVNYDCILSRKKQEMPMEELISQMEIKGGSLPGQQKDKAT